MAGVHDLNDGSKVFAGHRDDSFFGDIGAAFDLVAIRKGTGASGGGKDFFAGYGVHTVSLQVPLSQLDNGGNHIVGIWSASERPKVTVEVKGKEIRRSTTWVQVSRLGNPLINELLIPTPLKDKWTDSTPDTDKQFVQYYSSPILAKLLNQLYPQFGPFQESNRTDLVSVLLTGLKQPNLNFTGNTLADEIRLNLAIAPTAPVGQGNRLGVLGGDLAGWPNGRRLEDDVIDIAERAVGGALIGHSLPLGDGVNANDVPYMTSLPYQQRARETGAPSYYTKSEGVLHRALRYSPDDLVATGGLGALALSRHRFREALTLGQRAVALSPSTARGYGIVGDALVELGRYREAFAAFDRMASLKPSLSSYARVSYARELLGDVGGAAHAMRLAIDAAAGQPEALAWSRTQLGK